MLKLFKKKASFSQLGFNSDCHCHVLPGVDDGAATIQDSVAILKEMASMGIQSTVLTPHLNPDVYADTNEEVIKERYNQFLKDIPSELLSQIRLSLGAEYMVTQGFEDRDPSSLLQFQPGKVLIEMSYFYPSKNMEQAIFNLVMAGIHPVIAHPERYLYYSHKLSVYERFHDMGAEFQMNAISLSGAYGQQSLSILKYILDKGWYAYIGTDCHNVSLLKNLQEMRFDASLLKLHTRE